jgi:hypothetical protein
MIAGSPDNALYSINTQTLDLERIRKYAEALDPELMKYAAPGKY